MHRLKAADCRSGLCGGKRSKLSIKAIGEEEASIGLVKTEMIEKHFFEGGLSLISFSAGISRTPSVE